MSGGLDSGISRFSYRPPTILHGSGSIDRIGAELDDVNRRRALVVCGRSVGQNDALMDPIRSALGDRLVGEFARTTPRKRLSTAGEAAALAREVSADVLIGIGGGSSLDVAAVASLLVRVDRPLGEFADAIMSQGTFAVPSDDVLPVVTIPTTLAGAALSGAAGITVGPEGGVVDETAGGGISGPELTPMATVYDPRLIATTPIDVLRGSAMNGFDKGIETLYARTASPVTDATATRAVERFVDGVPALADSDPGSEALVPLVEGTLLGEYGCSRAETGTLSVIHAFGHALTRTEGLQQGVAHAIVAPHVVEHILERTEGTQTLLAQALGIERTSDGAAIAATISGIVETIGLPHRLRDVDGPLPEEFSEVARDVLADPMMIARPRGYEPEVSDIVAILESAW